MDFEKTLDELADARKAYEKKAQEIVKHIFKDIFKQIPELQMIRWVQYAPHFNDGDECIFSVHEPAFIGGTKAAIEALSEDDDFIDEGGWGSFEYCDGEVLERHGIVDLNPSSYASEHQKHKSPLNGEQKKLLKKLSKAMQGELEDALKEAYGTDAEVTVTAKGANVEEYSHD